MKIKRGNTEVQHHYHTHVHGTPCSMSKQDVEHYKYYI